MIEVPQTWYQKNWVTIALLVIFFPVGLVFMWKNDRWKTSIKFVITAAFGVVAIYFFIASPQESVKSIKLPYQIIEMDVNQTKTIACSLVPEVSDHSSKVAFYSSNEEIVRFHDDVLTSASEGTAEIYAKSHDGSVSSNKVKVTVVDRDLQKKKEKAKPVIDKIAAIKTSGENTVSEAQKAYNALSSDIKPLVTNIGILIAAQQKTEGQAAEANSSNDSVNVKSSQTVYISKTGKKYHRKNCPTLKGKGTAISLSEALADGLTPCSICNP